MVKKLINWVLNKKGYRIEKIGKNGELTMEGALLRCVKRGLLINSVIDVGASDGRWSRTCLKFLPEAKYLLIEAQDPHKKGLDQFKSENSNVDYILAAAGKNEGQIYFENGSLFGGLASETPFEKNCITVPVVSIDAEIKKRNLQPPFLIKLDTHGFEIPIILGAMNTIRSAELIIIETYNIR